MGPVFITVIGQCMGVGDTAAADYYFRKLLKITVMFALIWNALIFAVTPVVMRFYVLEDETKHLVILLVLLHDYSTPLHFPSQIPLERDCERLGM